MTVRVLHIFAPSFNTSFSGDSLWYRRIFGRWNNPEVEHLFLDFKKHEIAKCKEVANFHYSEIQPRQTRYQRAAWIFSLFHNLIRYRGRYDLIHIHVLWWATLLIAPWARVKRIPTIYESVLLGADTPGGIIQERFGQLKMLCLRSYRLILTISKTLTDDYQRNGFPEKQVKTLVKCVDTDIFFPGNAPDQRLSLRKKYSLPAQATIMLFVGSVIERKGVDVLLQAFARACTHRENLYLLIIGPSNHKESPSVNPHFVASLHGFIDQNDLAKKVRFMGLVQDENRLAELFRASNMFVFPSNNEGLGNVVLEAMASGLPVVVSNLPVLDNIVVPSENGLVVPMREPSLLCNAMLTLVDDLSLTKKMGKRGREMVENELAFPHWQENMTKIYQELIPPASN